MTSTGSGSAPATCLGCGCACDDIGVRLDGGRIVEARNACPLGVSWFGDGSAPARVRVNGRDAPLADALGAAAGMLQEAARPLVYLAPDVTCEVQREAIAIADRLGATLDSVTSSTALRALLAAQEIGRAGATLGEIRNRADVLVFWAVDPARRYPRYWTRYAPDPPGVHVPGGRTARTVVAVDVGDSRGPDDADLRVTVEPEDEVAVLTRLRANAGRLEPRDELASAVSRGRYVVFVADTEPDDLTARDPGRAAALIALTQALNATTRCALSTLRAGGNRSGADACMTWQTGYPAAVDFSRGFPRYVAFDAAASRLARGDVDALLIVGSASDIPADVLEPARRLPCAVIGPRATESPLAARVAVDTATAGIHEAGTALRLDDVPVPVKVVVEGPPQTMAVVRDLRGRLAVGSAL